jgi:preprotein translocase subunit SecA
MRNRIGWRQHLARFQGSTVDFDLGVYDAPLAAIARLEAELRLLPTGELERRARQLRDEVRSGRPLAGVRERMFALVREGARRALGERPFDVQVVAALALDQGRIVELQTGEGKTLAAVMPAALHALAGMGVHVLTFNDYLARRDAQWMGPVYAMLGLSTGFVEQASTPAERRHAYRADVTYVTAKEAGFDHLRDLQATEPDGVVHRPFHFALVDEADSLLIDEARVPLVIAGRLEGGGSAAPQLAALVRTLVAGVDFEVDEYGRGVEFTDAGIDRAERALACGRLFDEKNYRLLTELNCALHARVLQRRDVDYLVRGGRIEMIDEFTGRIVEDRHWPDGLQAALEAKEGLTRQADGQILGSITLQHFLQRYQRVCGMTGTAQEAAAELAEFYGVRVVVIPTNRPLVRIDRPDRIYATRAAKESAVVDEVRRVHAAGRPVLVGTLSVEESERLGARLLEAGVPCEVLNARHDAAEARVVARAGAPGAVTISTNMAGRGTDIRLGGDDAGQHDAVAALGGLYVIGTNLHETRRVDRQLRGRAGRQGDPGESRFFLSLEDDLIVRYGIADVIAARMIRLDLNDAPIEDFVVRREVARAQRIAESQNFEIRRTLWKYSSVVETQRLQIMERRQALLKGQESPDIWRSQPERRAALAAATSEDAVSAAERTLTIFNIDRAWRTHLSQIADLREGIHLVRLGGADPLSHFAREAALAFERLQRLVDEAVTDSLDQVSVAGGRLATGIDLKGPASTWTYLINDDPFRNQIGQMLGGPGGPTFAMASAAIFWPLLIAWGLVDRYLRKRSDR